MFDGDLGAEKDGGVVVFGVLGLGFLVDDFGEDDELGFGFADRGGVGEDGLVHEAE